MIELDLFFDLSYKFCLFACIFLYVLLKQIKLDHIGLDWMKLNQMKQVLIEVVEDVFEEFVEKYIFKDFTLGFYLKM